ncbi:hypothetical protein GG344DRAFT_66591 [Lentinula edodes]|nr:hypothetical protein GG344DRAFT_66591 [Lentinula edodes]
MRYLEKNDYLGFGWNKTQNQSFIGYYAAIDAFCNALYQLAAHPELVVPLREDVFSLYAQPHEDLLSLALRAGCRRFLRRKQSGGSYRDITNCIEATVYPKKVHNVIGCTPAELDIKLE